eukprot:scaffold56135_cov49-Attheya_sp.AAC.2
MPPTHLTPSDANALLYSVEYPRMILRFNRRKEKNNYGCAGSQDCCCKRVCHGFRDSIFPRKH